MGFTLKSLARQDWPSALMVAALCTLSASLSAYAIYFTWNAIPYLWKLVF